MLGYVKCNLCGADDCRGVLIASGKNIVACKRCGFIYVNPQDKSDGLLSFDKESFLLSMINHYNAQSSVRVRNCHERLDQIEKTIKKGKILDVGCSAGFFLREAERRGWAVLGIEPSERCSSYARKEFSLEVSSGEYNHENVKKNNLRDLNAITFWGVLGHMEDPNKSIRLTHEILRPGGIIAIETPNIESPIFKLFKQRWYHLSIANQNYFFSQSSLKGMIEKNGFKIITLETVARLYDDHWIDRRACPLAGQSRIMRFVTSLINSYVLQLLNTGDHLFAIGIKT